MQKHVSILSMLAVTVAIAASSISSEDALVNEPLSIRISTPVRYGSDMEYRTLPAQTGRHFHVVVTNDSNHDQKLWEAWNSWGFFNLRFDILDKKGVIIDSIVKSPDTIWTMNFPSHTVLKPRQHLVMDVDLSHREWVIARKARPYTPFATTDTAKDQSHLRIRAVFEIPKSDETDKQSVWVGKVQSEAESFQIKAKN